MFNFIRKIFSGPDHGEKSSPESGLESQETLESGADSLAPDDASGPWVGVDLDGTLAVWDNKSTLDRIGPPVPAMLAFVQRMVDNGIRVKIFTARAGEVSQIPKIRKWLEKHGLPPLEITNVKDYGMERFYDDRGIQVEKNTGRIITDLN